MVVLKLSELQEKWADALWLSLLIKRVLRERAIEIIKDVPYKQVESRVVLERWLMDQSIKHARFRAMEVQEQREHSNCMPKTFREFFQGKHPECDITILGTRGELTSIAIDRITQYMADYMDYIAERVLG